MRLANPLVLIALLFVAAPSSFAAEEKADAPAVKKVTVDEADKARTDKAVVIIDVRTPEEYAAGHIPGAVNIPVTGDGLKDFDKKIVEASKDKTPLVYCRSGNRSMRAAEKMQALGIKTILEMPRGWVGWTQAEKDVEKGPPRQK